MFPDSGIALEELLRVQVKSKPWANQPKLRSCMKYEGILIHLTTTATRRVHQDTT